MKHFLFGLIISTACGIASISSAGNYEPKQQFNSTALWFENWTGLSNGMLKVVMPNGKIIEVFTASGTPVFETRGLDLQDGIYTYSVTAATEETEEIVNPIDNGRGGKPATTQAVSFEMSGQFAVSRGAIVKIDMMSEEENE